MDVYQNMRISDDSIAKLNKQIAKYGLDYAIEYSFNFYYNSPKAAEFCVKFFYISLSLKDKDEYKNIQKEQLNEAYCFYRKLSHKMYRYLRTQNKIDKKSFFIQEV